MKYKMTQSGDLVAYTKDAGNSPHSSTLTIAVSCHCHPFDGGSRRHRGLSESLQPDHIVGDSVSCIG